MHSAVLKRDLSCAVSISCRTQPKWHRNCLDPRTEARNGVAEAYSADYVIESALRLSQDTCSVKPPKGWDVGKYHKSTKPCMRAQKGHTIVVFDDSTGLIWRLSTCIVMKLVD